MNQIGNVYIITNTINNKVYIGQTIRNIRQRFSEHMSLHQRGNAHLKSAVLKYGKESFNIEVLKTLETNNEDELFKFLDKWEKYYIKKYKSYDSEFGYNIDFGGQLNRVVSDESRKKMSESHKGVKLSLERIEKQREYMKNHPERWIDPIHNIGKQLSEGHKRKISEAQKGEKGNMWGKHHSDATKEKLSKSVSAAMINKYGKPVLQYSLDGEFIKEWNCIMNAAKSFNSKRSHIPDVCNGKRSSCFGYKWKWKYE